jgi:electron transfer flavoprotein alpha subunit
MAVQDGKIKRSALEVLSHMRGLAEAGGDTLEAALIVADATGLVEELKRYGAQKIYVVEHPAFEHPLNTALLAALEQVIRHAGPRVVAFASTESVKDVLGALAMRLDAAALPDVSSFSLSDNGVKALRPVMAAKMLARTEARAGLVLVSVRSGSYNAAEAPAKAVIETVPFDFDPGTQRQTLREVVQATGGAVDLSEARVVVAAGRGVKDEAGKALIQELADALGAAIGASRAVVENGLFPATAQIGQTGKVVSPDLYFAVGISGAIQHVAGMSNSRVIVAINKDADAPIFKYATYGIVGDLYKVLPPLIEELKEARG